MLRFYGLRLEEAYRTLPGGEFWPLTMALVAYQGIVAALVKQVQEKTKADEIPLDSEELAGIISYSRVPAE